MARSRIDEDHFHSLIFLQRRTEQIWLHLENYLLMYFNMKKHHLIFVVGNFFPKLMKPILTSQSAECL